uniref:Polyprotein n=1 Tax=Panagrolaimus sp. ES5 TaxID=591445 RepID=A0AC34G3U8_9BILA
MMSNNHAVLWPPQAYDGKVRFDVWESLFDMYISDRDITDSKKKVKVLLQTIGTNMLEKIIDWSPKKPQDMEYDDLIKLIKGKCERKPNLAALRVKFFNERQQPGQGLDEYFSHMAQLYGQCQLDKMTADEFGVLAVLKGLAQDDTRQFIMTSLTEIKSISKVQELASMFEQGKAAAREIKGDGGKASSKSYAMQHDTGSAVSIISKKVWHIIGKPRIHASKMQLQSYNQMITVLGQCKINVQHGHQIKQQWVIVVSKGDSLFGRNWIHAFNVQKYCNSPRDQKHGERTVFKQHTSQKQTKAYYDRARSSKQTYRVLDQIDSYGKSEKHRDTVTREGCSQWQRDAIQRMQTQHRECTAVTDCDEAHQYARFTKIPKKRSY